MKILKLLCLIIVLLGLMPASSAWARGGHDGGHHFGGHHFGGHHYGGYGFGWELGLGYYGLGYGRYWPYYGGYSPYHGSYGGGYGGSYPPVVYVQQQGGVQAATKSQTDYWHYCSNPKGYYPHVKNCPDGWMQVVSQLSPAQ